MPPDSNGSAEHGQPAQKAESTSDVLDTPDLVFKRSFVGELPRRVFLSLLVPTLVILGVTIVILHDFPPWVSDAGMLFWAGAIGVWLVLIRAWRAARQKYIYNEDAWLAGLPFELNKEGYKAVLHRKTNIARCTLVVETNVRYEKTTDGLAKALHGKDVEGVLPRRPGTYEVRSKLFDTLTQSEDDSLSSNVRLHHWFKNYVQTVLMPLHTAGILKEVRVESPE